MRDMINKWGLGKIIGEAPESLAKQPNLLKASCLDTPLGPMLAIGNEDSLYLLEFIDSCGLVLEVERLRNRARATIILGSALSISAIDQELKAYFTGDLKEFKTPLCLTGSPFQKLVWQELIKIPYGEMRSYSDQSIAIGKPTAYRAVANANGVNPVSIVIPCHRIIRSDGTLGGYAGGLTRKRWLIDHEKENS